MLDISFSHREHGGHGGFKHTYSFVESFFSHRAHRVHGGFKLTVSSPQKASGIQSSQSVIAKGGCWVLGIRC